MSLINLHTHTFFNETSVLEVVNQYPWEFNQSIPKYSIGIHPWYINEDRLSLDLRCIGEKLQLKECLALGECGLDKRIETPIEIQTKVFKQQIEIVQKTSKPIILHCVAAYQEMIAIKKEMNIENSMVIHGFSKNIQVANSLLDNGFYLSFGKYLLRNPELAAVFKEIPNNRIFLETDTIKENIEEVYKKAAQIKKITLEELKIIVGNNFKRVFNS